MVYWTSLQRLHMDHKVLCQIVVEESSLHQASMRKGVMSICRVVLYNLYASLYVCNTSE